MKILIGLSAVVIIGLFLVLQYAVSLDDQQQMEKSKFIMTKGVTSFSTGDCLGFEPTDHPCPYDNLTSSTEIIVDDTPITIRVVPQSPSANILIDGYYEVVNQDYTHMVKIIL